MRISNIKSSDQQTFGTKVKMNPKFINYVCCSGGEAARLRKAINILENNGVNDVLSINQFFIPQERRNRLFAEVYEIDGDKLKKGDAIEASLYTRGPRGGFHCQDIVELYERAKQSVTSCGTRMSKWQDYI